MSEANRDILSAGMDGELSREEIRFLLRRLDSDQTLVQAWSRYHVARDGLRGQLEPSVSADFASRVMAAIDAEDIAVATAPARTVARMEPRRRWLQWSAGGAIAASVAVAALMFTQPAERGVTTGVAQAGTQAGTVSGNAIADAGHVAQPPGAPTVPQWLSGGTSVSQFTQKAAFGSGSESDSSYLTRVMPYQIHGTRAVEASGSNYILLVRPDGSRYVQPLAEPQVEAR
ncbi:sigma-E factor negative regulatory protein RseA [Luteibacter rhizovicinus]|uniref:Sigma-E factor negative regulatory protein RseA n=1 Tax=Luteibacter rhizovicinus TaxID=242606 RepID=A0A4R3YZY5_9GAMM|nr:sigma-E factor negative regulatory protein [Luteibacter rhizovicinus]TCV97498.1 sigma-E factor negative regulatory protein RseA [Luteibacter rhizovicinus]